jgi:catechol 2,3-dioxygenase-like lactoylglutathione lyase family enzyme
MLCVVPMPNIPSAIIGPGLYKIGYVTNDLDEAISYFEEQLGFEEFVRFEPQFDAEQPDGTSGHAHLRCAFSKGRSNVVELMEPYEGRVDLWREPLQGVSGFAVRFHHLGHVTDDLRSVRASFEAKGLDPVLWAQAPVFAFAYFPVPAAAHYVEHIQYFGEGSAFLDGVRAPKY